MSLAAIHNLISSGDLRQACRQIFEMRSGTEFRPPNTPFGQHDNLNEIHLIKSIISGIDRETARALITTYSEEFPDSRAGHTLNAEQLYQRGEFAPAMKAIQTSLTLFYDDLYAQGIYSKIVGALNPAVAEQAARIENELPRRICLKPFEHFEVSDGGAVFLCCPSYLPVPVGNINEQTVEEIWNSDAAKAIRDSIQDSSYRYCSRVACGQISAMSLPLKTEAEPPSHKSPTRFHLAHDRSCNLSCPSCRKEPIGNEYLKKAEFESIEAKLMPHLKGATEISLLGSGDPLTSRSSLSILGKLRRAEFPKLSILMQTNGMLFTENWWKLNPHLHDFPFELQVSVDAANEDTYSRVRRGGNLKTLLKNFEFIKNLRLKGSLKWFVIKFVVQEDNFREMKDFVDLGNRYASDLIVFSRLRNWGTYGDTDFKQRDVSSPNHVNHKKFRETLKDPCFRGKNVTLGDLSGLGPAHRDWGLKLIRWFSSLGIEAFLKKIYYALPRGPQERIYRLVFKV